MSTVPVPEPHHSYTSLAQNEFLLMLSKYFPWGWLSLLPLAVPSVSLGRVGLWFLCATLLVAPLCLVFLKRVLFDIYMCVYRYIYVYLYSFGKPQIGTSTQSCFTGTKIKK